MLRTLILVSSLPLAANAFLLVNNGNFNSLTCFDTSIDQSRKLNPLRYRNGDGILMDEHGAAVVLPEIYKSFQEKQTQTKYDLIWEERFQEIKDYCDEHGNCNVPNKVNGRLSRWVAYQRRAYKMGEIQPKRYYALQSIHFQWTKNASKTPDSIILPDEHNFVKLSPIKKRRRKVSKRTPWSVRFCELKEFQKLHGHCIVPQYYAPNPGLGIWVKAQRRQNKVHRSTGCSEKVSSRIQMLNSIGFAWNVINMQNSRNRRGKEILTESPKKNPSCGYVVPFDFEDKTSQQLHSAWIERFKEFK